MELPSRPKGDRYTPPGRYRELQSRIRRRVTGLDIPTMFLYSFDQRTRLGPYLYVDKALIPGAPLAVGAALRAAGFGNLRLVLEQWNPRIRPHLARLDGRPPEMLFVSAMQIHSARAYEHIRSAWKLGDDRPLVLAGGPKAIYEPWDFFALSPDGRVGADVVVTGEDFVVLELMDRLLEHKLPHESMRTAFDRCRREGLLEDVPGLVYRPDDAPGPPDYVVSTGIQRLVQDLGELPSPILAMDLFEPPHGRHELSQRPLRRDQLRRHATVVGVVTTRGCKFRCPYCPIPAYNQFTFRYKEPQRLVEEISSVAEQTGITFFFGTDDNFFNSRESLEEIYTAMARGKVHGKPFRDAIMFGTEATEFDVYKNRDILPLAREAGTRAIWFGIEDMTGELVNKGQSVDKTGIVFRELLKHGIAPMPMMMHHDGQPLWSREGMYGLLNQANYLRKAGAVSFQATVLTPIIGTKLYEQPYRDGMMMKSVGGVPVEDYQRDGNHCIATLDRRPWQKQLNILAAYALFYNPIRLLAALLKRDSLWSYRVMYQTLGTKAVFRSAWRVRGYFWRLLTGKIERHTEVPQPRLPMVVIEPEPIVEVQQPAPHAARTRQGRVELPVLAESRAVS